MVLGLLTNSGLPAQRVEKITYLFHSGWLLESERLSLIIDYVPSADQVLDSLLFNKLKEAAQAGKETFIFITHQHHDHFHQSLLNWPSKIKGLRVILGWNYDVKDETIKKVYDGNRIQAGSLTIHAFPSTDDGSAFLISTGTQTFYHAGDHALWSDNQRTAFFREVENARRTAGAIDIAFLPIARGKFGKCASTETITEGALKATELLNAKIVFPMHMECGYFQSFKEFKEAANGKFPGVTVLAPTQYHQEFKMD